MLPYDLSPYHLTLPVNSLDQLIGKAIQIPGSQLTAGYTSEWFEPVNNTYKFRCPDGGALTDTAHYARSELRNEMEWTYEEDATDRVTFAVTQLGEGQKVVVHQIHDANEPWIKVAYTHYAAGGHLRALVKTKDGADDVAFMLLKGLHLGDQITSLLTYTAATDVHAAHLKINANNYQINVSMHRRGHNGNAYFKRGAYYQNAEHKGLICEVVHY